MEQVDPDKPIYQFVWGGPPPFNATFFGKMEQRELRNTKEQIINNQLALDLKRGSNCIFYGVWVALICIVIYGIMSTEHVISSKFNKIAEWGIIGGLLSIVAGMWFKKAVEIESTIVILSIIGAGFILSREKVRKWSISHIFNKSKSEGVKDG